MKATRERRAKQLIKKDWMARQEYTRYIRPWVRIYKRDRKNNEHDGN